MQTKWTEGSSDKDKNLNLKRFFKSDKTAASKLTEFALMQLYIYNLSLSLFYMYMYMYISVYLKAK